MLTLYPRLGLMSDAMDSLPGPLVSSSWLDQHLGAPNLVVCDVRWYVDGRSGEAAFEAGHIPGAVWIDLDRDLAGTNGPGRHPLPHPEQFAAAMASRGIGDDTVVVAYDDAGGSIAARLWWMLSVIGRKAAVLDGGISGWTGELSIDTVSTTANVAFTPKPWPPHRVADVVAVDFARRRPDSVVLDARSAARFAGEPNPIDRRPGHIPGAVSAPWTLNVDPASGLFRSASELRSRFESLGVTADTPAITHCGSGVTACHNLLALQLAGFDNAQLYPGSWSDWESDPSRPVISSPPQK
jgi:thiosulfate/3-mercaptopyruvate sulfurtransferase